MVDIKKVPKIVGTVPLLYDRVVMANICKVSNAQSEAINNLVEVVSEQQKEIENLKNILSNYQQ